MLNLLVLEYLLSAMPQKITVIVLCCSSDKQILNHALDDVGFWHRFREMKKREQVVWLLLYDMQGRKFARAGSTAAIAIRNEALREAGLLKIERALLDMKTKLAASLSRLRISGSALSLGTASHFNKSFQKMKLDT